MKKSRCRAKISISLGQRETLFQRDVLQTPYRPSHPHLKRTGSPETALSLAGSPGWSIHPDLFHNRTAAGESEQKSWSSG